MSFNNPITHVEHTFSFLKFVIPEVSDTEKITIGNGAWR